jgi:hypothetical protein
MRLTILVAVLAGTLCIVLSCVVRPPLSVESAREAIVAFEKDGGYESVKGGGTIVFGQNGERVSAVFDLNWSADTAFVLQVSTAFGMIAASVSARESGPWTVEIGDTLRRQVDPGSPVVIGRDFLGYSCTWLELLRVCTGRLPCLSVFSGAPDSQCTAGRNVVLFWKSVRCGTRDIAASAKIDNKSHSVTEIVYENRGTERWTLAEGNFKGRVAKEIRFTQSSSNYFYVTYHAVKIRSSPSAGKTF